MGEARGLGSEALRGPWPTCLFGGIDAEQTDGLDLAVDIYPNRVAVDDVADDRDDAVSGSRRRGGDQTDRRGHVC